MLCPARPSRRPLIPCEGPSGARATPRASSESVIAQRYVEMLDEHGMGEVCPIYRRGDRVLVELPFRYCDVTIEALLQELLLKL